MEMKKNNPSLLAVDAGQQAIYTYTYSPVYTYIYMHAAYVDVDVYVCICICVDEVILHQIASYDVT